MKPLTALLLAVLAVTVSACSSATAAPGPAAGGPLRVVASTDVYGDIVRAVGGDDVSVTSLIDDPSKDPHEYEGDAQAQLALSKATLVVQNGGGYDDFLTTMLAALPTRPTVLDVADLSGYDQQPASGEFNEHLWYDFPTMATLANRLSDELGTAAPEHAARFRSGAKTFTDGLRRLEQREATLRREHGGEGAAVTEPVPLYLLDAAGLTNKTPEEFSAAVEEGSDVAPSVLAETTALLDRHQVALLADNPQTAGPQTEAVRAAATQNDVPVLTMTETLPSGDTYLTWMGGNLDALTTALAA